MNQNIFEQIRELIAVATDHSLEEITPSSQIETDLGVNLEEGFSRLIAIINQSFEIKLDEEHLLSELEKSENTVEQLAKLVEEEIELG